MDDANAYYKLITDFVNKSAKNVKKEEETTAKTK